MPEIADAALKPDNAFFKRSDRIHRPHANQAGRFVLGRAPNLHRQSQYLGKQYDHQDGDIAVTADEVFHGGLPLVYFASPKWFSVSNHKGTRSCTKAIALLDRNLAQEFEVAQHLARAQHHAAQRIVGDRNRKPGFFADALVQILEQRASTRKHNATIADVRRKLWRRALKGNANRIHNRRHTFAQRFPHFTVIHGNGLGNALDQVAPFDLHSERLVQRIRGTNLDLDLLPGALADQQIIFPLQIIHDGFVHLVAGHAHRTRIDDAAERNDGDVSSAAANIDNHVAAGLSDGKPGANRRHHRLLHQMHFARLRPISRVHDRALLED